MRAIAQNRYAAPLMGINVHRVQALSFGMGLAAAGIAGGRTDHADVQGASVGLAQHLIERTVIRSVQGAGGAVGGGAGGVIQYTGVSVNAGDTISFTIGSGGSGAFWNTGLGIDGDGNLDADPLQSGGSGWMVADADHKSLPDPLRTQVAEAAVDASAPSGCKPMSSGRLRSRRLIGASTIRTTIPSVQQALRHPTEAMALCIHGSKVIDPTPTPANAIPIAMPRRRTNQLGKNHD